jgi:hypothetical protein
MTKKHFIALADKIRQFRTDGSGNQPFSAAQIRVLADFCKEQNPNFNHERWLAYIAGECGPNGGQVKK